MADKNNHQRHFYKYLFSKTKNQYVSMCLVQKYFICHKIKNWIGHKYNLLMRSSPIYNFKILSMQNEHSFKLNTCLRIDFLFLKTNIYKNVFDGCFYLPFIKFRFNNRQEISR
jgi:hypothetical protein